MVDRGSERIAAKDAASAHLTEGGRMVHYAHPDPSLTHTAWCGARILGIDEPDSTPLDCIVCGEMDVARDWYAESEVYA